jgi:dihydrofolate reductase
MMKPMTDAGAGVKCSIFIGVSLDGFIARENGDIDWLVKASEAAEVDGVGDYGFQAFFDTVDALVTGRATYETVVGFKEWPYAGKKVIVLSHQTLTPPAAMADLVEFMNAPPREVVRELGARGLRHLYVDGGRTIQGFLLSGVPLEMTITRLPVLIGRGIPLFGPLERDLRLVHLETHTFPDGLVQSRYRTV